MQYTLTLPAGTITIVKKGVYQGSNTTAQWMPCNPIQNGGWKQGDTLVVTCSLNLNPPINPAPPASEYAGLCAGACAANNQTAINTLLNQALTLPLPNPGQLLGNGISNSPTPNASSIFYNAQSLKGTFVLSPASRGTLTNYTYQYTMSYNAQNTVTGNGSNVEIVFGYGDPMNSEVDS